MSAFVEGNLEITFRNVLSARKFDEEYRLSHCMKAVDFIVELDDRYIFIEIKDPQTAPNSGASVADYAERFMRRQLDSDLKYKFRDSYLYEWASGRADKPNDYYVLIAVDDLEPAVLDRRSTDLQRQLPTGLPRGSS